LLLARRPNKGAILDTQCPPSRPTRTAIVDRSQRDYLGLAENSPHVQAVRFRPALSQPRYINKGRATTSASKNVPSPGGRSPGWPAMRTAAVGPMGRCVASHRPPGGLPHDSPGGRAGSRMCRSRRGLPPGGRVAGVNGSRKLTPWRHRRGGQFSRAVDSRAVPDRRDATPAQRARAVGAPVVGASVR
jgi:hypothetical protein